MTEEWRTIKEFPDYEISNYGHVRNIFTNFRLDVHQKETGGSDVVQFPNPLGGKRPIERSLAKLGCKAFNVARPVDVTGREYSWRRLACTFTGCPDNPYVIHLKGISAAATAASKSQVYQGTSANLRGPDAALASARRRAKF